MDNGINITKRGVGSGGSGGSGSGTTPISGTYAAILALQNTSALKAGSNYLITDCVTTHMIPFTTVIRSGNLEPLILFADSVNTFDKEAFSPLYPKDIIYYDINDNSCEDGTWNTALQRYEVGTPRTGRIYYRKDTINGNEVHNDYKNVKYRRWAVDAVLWVSGAPYLTMDVIKSTIDGNIYVCKIAMSGTTDPSIDTANWQLWLDVTTTTAFWSWTPTKADFAIGGITTTNLIINNVTAGTDYNDYYMFCITDELTNGTGIINGSGAGIIGLGYKDFKFGSINKDYISYIYSITIDGLYNNIVFYLTPNSSYEYLCNSNTFGDSCFNSTFGDANNNLTFGNFNYSLVFRYINTNSTFGDANNNLTFGTQNANLIFGTQNTNLIFGNANLDSTFENTNTNLIFGNDAAKLTFGNYNYSLIFGNDAAKLTFGNYNYSLTFGNSCITSIFKNNINGLIFGNAIANNTFSNGTSNADFTLATHVYGAYDCEIFTRLDGTSLLKYLDNSNAYQFVVITS